MNSNRRERQEKGFTLVEVLVAMVFFLMCSLGILTFTMMTVKERKSLEKRQYAYAIAYDVAERMRILPDGSSIINPKTTREYVGYNSNGSIVSCATSGLVDLTTFSEAKGSNGVYLFDSDHDGVLDSGEIAESANTEIDHPTTSVTYDDVQPLRKMSDDATFYVVWSVRYFPCNHNDQAKIFLTVYWFEPEPVNINSSGELFSAINNGVYNIRKITLTVDRSYKVLP